jgi:hypothetical protein
MIIWDDVDPDNPLDVAAISNDVNLSQNNHDAPSITPASADTLVVHGFVAGGPPDTCTAPTGTTQRLQQSAVSGALAIMVVDKAGPAAGVASGVANAALTGFQEAIVFTLALKSATASETLRPTGVSLTNLSGSHTDIDQDPDGTIADNAGHRKCS